MSGYVYELARRGEYPDRMCCPVHGMPNFFKKASGAKFWKCPMYFECGMSVGSRRLVGHATTMWVKQSRKGKAWLKAKNDSIRACTEVLEPDDSPAIPPPRNVWAPPAPVTPVGQGGRVGLLSQILP